MSFTTTPRLPPRDGAPRHLSAERRLRVLNLARDAGSGVGGTEVLVYEFAHRLDPARFVSFLCTTRSPLAARKATVGAEREQLLQAGVQVLSLDRPRTASLLPFARLYRLLLRERIDIVHAHMPRASLPGTVLGRLARVPVIISHEHGSVLGDGKRVRKFVDREVVARGSDAVLCVSAWDAQNLVKFERIPSGKIRVVPNGVAPFAPAANGMRELLAPAGVALVGAVGRLVPVKAYDVLIRAVALLKRRGVAIRCVIAGEGPEREQLQRLVGALDCEAEVWLAGLRSDVPALLAALDVAVLPSDSEGSPLAVLEYMAAGLPIVATAVGGVPELIENEVHGLLVPPRDAAALAAAIERVICDRELAVRLGQQARLRQASEFDLAVCVRRLEGLYTELCAAKAERRQRR
ncbi:MAG: glycosyltransferase [Solirubrobacteraceae bacterium]